MSEKRLCSVMIGLGDRVTNPTENLVLNCISWTLLGHEWFDVYVHFVKYLRLQSPAFSTKVESISPAGSRFPLTRERQCGDSTGWEMAAVPVYALANVRKGLRSVMIGLGGRVCTSVKN